MKKWIVFVLFFALLSSTCEDNESEGYYRFKVTSTGNTFFGIYTIDGKDDYYFPTDEDKIETEGNYYSFDKELNNPSTISIKVDGYDYNELSGSQQTTRISIEIYEGDELVLDKYLTASSYDQHLYLTLYYEFKGTNEDTEETENEEESK